MGITIGIDNDRLSVALGGSDTKIDVYLGRRSTEPGSTEYRTGFLSIHSSRNPLTARQKQRSRRAWHTTCSTQLGVNLWTLV
ncbi:MAG TPA: hypothetical protein VN939_05025, partial [Chthoniobacterales bacterium]|nr:hypothetical protein [Chthoniobacterales bacterium]